MLFGEHVSFHRCINCDMPPHVLLTETKGRERVSDQDMVLNSAMEEFDNLDADEEK